jgi:hypothetical protein
LKIYSIKRELLLFWEHYLSDVTAKSRLPDILAKPIWGLGGGFRSQQSSDFKRVKSMLMMEKEENINMNLRLEVWLQGREPALQAQSPEFKTQCPPPPKKFFFS